MPAGTICSDNEELPRSSEAWADRDGPRGFSNGSNASSPIHTKACMLQSSWKTAEDMSTHHTQYSTDIEDMVGVPAIPQRYSDAVGNLHPLSFLRMGDVVTPSDSAFDSWYHLAYGDVRVNSRGEPA